MTGQPPPIDPRDRSELVAQTTALATRYSGWQPPADGRADAGQALIGVFARFAELIVQRLNQVPERDYLAFLNLIGTQPSPPLPARVPLTFRLAERSRTDALVPAGTQVAADPLAGEDDEVVFETGTDLVVTRSELLTVLVDDPEQDSYADRGAEATGGADGPFAAFTGDRPVPHRFFVACDPVLTAEGTKDVTLTLATPDGALFDGWPISWSYWDGTRWQPAQAGTATADGAWTVTLTGLPQLPPHEVNGTSAGWLRAQLDMPLPHDTPRTPTVTGIEVQTATEPEPVPPPGAFAGGTPLDVTRDFRPFGEQPRFNDTCYLACPASLVRPGADLVLDVTLTNNPDNLDGPVPPVRTDGDPRIVWEGWDGTGWRTVPVTVLYSDADSQYAFTSDATVLLTPPDGFARTEVHGVQEYWLRIRLIDGDFGTAASYTQNADGGYELVDATFAPPVIKTLSWSSRQGLTAPVPAPVCVTQNDFQLVTHHITDHITDHTTDHEDSDTPWSVVPFTPNPRQDPALYLGFDQPFDTRPVTLYLQVEPPQPGEVTAGRLAGTDLTDRADLVWEYRGTDGWRPLAAVDETAILAERGMVRFVGPPDLTPREHFGQRRCWLRLRVRHGTFPVAPRLRRILPNTTWATQAVTVTDEILGSGTAEAGQRITTAQRPVLAGQRLMIREPERPSAAEEAELAAAEGADAVAVTENSENSGEAWVRWRAVTDFHRSGPNDRHYTIDPRTGEIGFGDGRAGRMPPRGRNNIRITYRTGGGEDGNRAAGTVATLKSAVPSIDSVTHHEPASGGSGWEPLERVRARGPRSLRHRDRAVTAEDFEDLAFESSTEVARVRAVLPSRFDPFDLWLDPAAPEPGEAHLAAEADAGAVGVVVVPQSAASRPIPGLGLLRRVEEYLRARCGPTIALWAAGPEWIEVTVAATVVASSPDVAGLVGGRVEQTLERFLHPLTGGPEGTGWAFGRKPHRSDLYAAIGAVDGVDHIPALTVVQVADSDELGDQLTALLGRPLAQLAADPPTPDEARWLARALVHSGRHQITVTLGV